MFLILIAYKLKLSFVTLANNAFVCACRNRQRYKLQYCFPSLNNLKARYISVRLDKDIYNSILMCKGWSIVDGWGSKEIFCQVLWVLCVYFAGAGCLYFPLEEKQKTSLEDCILNVWSSPQPWRDLKWVPRCCFVSQPMLVLSSICTLQLPPVWALSAQVWGKVIHQRGWEPGSLASTWMGNHEKNVRDAAEHSSWWVSVQRTETVPPCRHFSGHRVRGREQQPDSDGGKRAQSSQGHGLGLRQLVKFLWQL